MLFLQTKQEENTTLIDSVQPAGDVPEIAPVLFMPKPYSAEQALEEKSVAS